jgi:hypothetical protein
MDSLKSRLSPFVSHKAVIVPRLANVAVPGFPEKNRAWVPGFLGAPSFQQAICNKTSAVCIVGVFSHLPAHLLQQLLSRPLVAAAPTASHRLPTLPASRLAVMPPSSPQTPAVPKAVLRMPCSPNRSATPEPID